MQSWELLGLLTCCVLLGLEELAIAAGLGHGDHLQLVWCQVVLVMELKMKTFLLVLVAATRYSTGSVIFCGSWDSCLGLILGDQVVTELLGAGIF